MSRAPTLLAGLLLACAAAPPTPAPKVETKAHPGLEGTRRPLPASLDRDPGSLKPAPLEHSPPKPEVIAAAGRPTLYLLEDHELPLVEVAVIVGMGRRDDPEGRPGTLELLERTLRRGGAGDRTADAFDQAAESHAIDLGTSVGDDRTTLTASTLARHLPLAMGLLGDLLRRPRFQQDRLEVERGRAIEMVRRRNDDPHAIAARELRSRLYGEGSPWARLPTQDDLKAVSREDVQKLHATYFEPANTRIVVVGDFERGALLDLLEGSVLAGWTGAAPPRPAPVADGRPQGPGRFLGERPGIGQAVVLVGQRFLPRHHPDQYAAELMDYILGGGVFQSRLGQAIRSDRGLAYSVRSGARKLLDDEGYYYVFAGTKPATTGEVLDLIGDIVGKMHTAADVTPDELDRSREAFLNRHVFNYETAYQVAVQRAVLDYYGYEPDWLERYPERIGAVTAADIARVAREHLRPDEMVTVVVSPTAPPGDGWEPLDLERAVR